jgi:hypothetical protein
MDERLPSLHYGPIEAISPEQNQLALFKLAHYQVPARLASGSYLG